MPKLECTECGHDAKRERRLRKTHRRWGRIAVGLILVLLSAYPLAIVGGYWREQAVMRKYGLITNYSHNRSTGPVWLVERLPDELGRFFERITRLSVHAPAQLAACPSLRHLHALWITRVQKTPIQVTDADLVHLKGLSNLRKLGFWGTRVTDAGLAHLSGLSKLTLIRLNNEEQVTDAGLVHLKGLSNLEELELSFTQVTDAGLADLKGLAKLTELYLVDAPVTDAGVAKLKEALPNVRVYWHQRQRPPPPSP